MVVEKPAPFVGGCFGYTQGGNSISFSELMCQRSMIYVRGLHKEAASLTPLLLAMLRLPLGDIIREYP